ncbi:hypothetical protein [Paenibacillus alvei]|nr:hypothetical protein [Paenibacillus alvei]
MNRKRHGGTAESFYERVMDAHIGNQLNTKEWKNGHQEDTYRSD